MQTHATSEKSKSTTANMHSHKQLPFFSPAFIQPKLTIGPVDDPYEREADSVADRVMRMPENPVQSALFSGSGSITTIQRHCADCEAEDKLQRKEEEIIQSKQGKRFDILRKCSTCGVEDAIQPNRNGFVSLSSKRGSILHRKCATCEQEEKDAIQPKPNCHVQLKSACSVLQRKCNDCEQEDRVMMKGNAATPASIAAPAVHQVLNSPGKPMDKSTLLFMESRFGYDFSNVQIHNDTLAHTSSAEINALAYTYGNHVVFGNGQYQPQTDQGKKLLAHELVHALQQTNPTDRKTPHHFNACKGNYSKIITPRVQRFIFWNQYNGGRYNRKGQDTHEELEGLFEAQGIQTEVSIPNGNADDVGLDYQGRADLYHSTNKQVPGVTFVKPIRKGVTCSGVPKPGTPAKFRNKGSAVKNPRLESGSIVFDGAAPSNIEVGDIKPAEEKSVAAGKSQVSNYQKGLKFFQKQVNCFSGNTWSLTPAALNPKIPTINNSPLRDLGISDFNLVADKANGRFGARTNKVFSPADLNIEIKGKLHAVNIPGGVVAYFYYPVNLSDLLETLELGPGSKGKNKLLVGYIELAGELQDKVLFPLKAPPTVKPKRIPGTAINQAGENKPSPTPLKDSSKQVQRKVPKAASKLEDTFKYAPWSENLTKYKNAFKKTEPKLQNSLKLLEQIYKIQDGPMSAEAKTVAQGQGKSLPQKSSFDQPVGGKQKGTTAKTRNLTNIYDWMRPWAMNPLYDKIGFFREKLGGGFVTVLTKLGEIKKKIVDWINKTVGGRASKEPPKSTLGKIIRTLGRAIVAIVKNILPQSLNLVVNAIKTGIVKKLKSIFEESFIGKYLEKFKEWSDTIKDFVNNPKDFLGDTVATLFKDVKWVKDIFDNLSWLTPILKAAKCLSNWRKCAIDYLRSKANDASILLCLRFVQKRVLGFIMGISFFKKLPATLANLVLEKMQDLMPADPAFLKEILSERAPDVGAETDDPMFLCEGSSEGGLFKLDSAPSIDGGGNDEKSIEEMAKLMEQMSEEEIEEMLKKAREKGLMDKPFDQEKMKNLKKEFDKDKAGKASPDKATDKPRLNDTKPGTRTQQDRPKPTPQDQGKGQQQDKALPPVDKPLKPAPKDPAKGQAKDEAQTPFDKTGKPAPIKPVPGGNKDQGGIDPQVVQAPYSGRALGIGVVTYNNVSSGISSTYSSLSGPDSGSGAVTENFQQIVHGVFCGGLGLTLYVDFSNINSMYKSGVSTYFQPRPSTLPPPTVSIKALMGTTAVFNESGKAPLPQDHFTFIPPFKTTNNMGKVLITIGEDKIKEKQKNIIQLEIVLDDSAATNTILTLRGTVEYIPHDVPTCT